MVTAWSVDPQQLCLNTNLKASFVIPKESDWAKRGIQTFHIAVQLLDHLEGNKRPGLGALALCSFIIWFSLARLCPFFTPSGPEQTSPLAGVPFLQAPFCTLHAGKFRSSRSPFMVALCWGLHYSSGSSPVSFPVPGGADFISRGCWVAQSSTDCDGHSRPGLRILAALFWVIWKENAPDSSHYGCLLGGKCFDKWLCASASYLTVPS